MRRVLMGTTAVLGGVLTATPAVAADGIKLSLGGFARTAVLQNFDDHGTGDLGNNRYNDGVFSDSEIHFLGSTTLDSGLTVGARIELEGEQKTDNQIHKAYVYFAGGLGEVRIGSQNGALETLCITPVGGTANFGAFSQDQVINNAFSGFSAGICEGVDSYLGSGNSQKLTYLTPNFGGFQLGLSWSPNGGHKSQQVTDFHSGMPTTADAEQRNVIEAYAIYSRDFNDWSISWGGGGSWALSEGGNGVGGTKGAFYQTGLNVTFGNLSVGGAFEYFENGLVFAQSSANPGTGGTVDSIIPNQDMWVAGGGIAYNIEAWTLGLQYSYSNLEGLTTEGANRYVHTIALTGNYALGPGIAIDGTIQYARATGSRGDAAHGGYESLGLGIGTDFTF